MNTEPDESLAVIFSTRSSPFDVMILPDITMSVIIEDEGTTFTSPKRFNSSKLLLIFVANNLDSARLSSGQTPFCSFTAGSEDKLGSNSTTLTSIALVNFEAFCLTFSIFTVGDDGVEAQDAKNTVVKNKPVSYTHLTLPTIYSV